MRAVLRTWRWPQGRIRLVRRLKTRQTMAMKAKIVRGDADDDPTNDPTETPLSKEPSQTISKKVSANADEDASGDISLGDSLTYTVTATNIGNITLTEMVVVDMKLSPNSTTCDSVTPGASCLLVGTYSVTQENVDAGVITNLASVVSAEIGELTETELQTLIQRRPLWQSRRC